MNISFLDENVECFFQLLDYLPIFERTNNIGIEGIEAENLESYIHCEKAEEYIYWISKLLSDNLIMNDKFMINSLS